jgi:hypothetical protein
MKIDDQPQKPQLNTRVVRRNPFSPFLMLIRPFERMFCKHKNRIEIFRSYEEKYISGVCLNCGKVVIEVIIDNEPEVDSAEFTINDN